MTTLVPVTGFLDEPTQLLLTTTDVTDVKAIAAGTTAITTVHGMILVNAGASARVVSVWVVKDTTSRLIWTGSIAAGTTETEALKYPLKLYAKSTARKITAQAAAANEVTVTLITSLASQSGTGAA